MQKWGQGQGRGQGLTVIDTKTLALDFTTDEEKERLPRADSQDPRSVCSGFPEAVSSQMSWESTALLIAQIISINILSKSHKI